LRIEKTLILATCILLLGAAGAQAQNLVPNPRFDQNVDGWTLQQGSATWSNLDASSSAFSGSLYLVPFTTGGEASVLSGCFPATPGAYELEYKNRIPENDIYSVTVFLRWYSDTGCSQFLGNSTSFGTFFHGANWETVGSRLFGADIIAPPGTRGAKMQVVAHTKVYLDDMLVQRKGSCASDSCLNNGRFAVDVRWTTDLTSGQGRPVNLTSDSAFFWFFDPNNIELVVKVLDGCAVNGRYWVFVAGLTNVRVEITVTDVATGTAKTYVNPEGQAFLPIQDTSAFATCL
jgi:hypothetical protein